MFELLDCPSKPPNKSPLNGCIGPARHNVQVEGLRELEPSVKSPTQNGLSVMKTDFL